MVTDPFLDDVACIKRLVREWEKHGRLIVGFDFDNTIFDYYQEGHTFPKVIQLLKDCKEAGFVLTLFTSCNQDRMPELIKYMEDNKIPYDLINETPDYIPFKGRKIYFNVLLDDRAGLSAAYRHLSSVIAHIRSVKSMQNLNGF